MPFSLRREVQVALSLKTQSIPFRIVKWAIVVAVVCSLWGTGWLWPTLAAMLVTSLCVHFIWRRGTRGWTRSWGGWEHH